MIAPPRFHRGFSLIEVTLTIILMGIVAATVMPSLTTIEDTRGAAAADEVRRLLAVARGRAMMTGCPCGVDVDPETETLRLVQIIEEGGDVEPMTDGLGAARDSVVMPSIFRGVGISEFTDGAGTGGAGTAWFGYDGIPEVRDASGALISMADEDIRIEMTGGEIVIVRAVSGLIE
ncbi:MAG: prepilin-type N-terminal cleavage/methylation domain-containing protein [Phycisphaeraceae bacterium]|nr:prepilin-type N-terminal cleavage/methylation domain-containing protein [Phycisphaeraceae bacterium]